MSTPESVLLTPAEYLEIERQSEMKHEYINGRMYVMSPGVSNAHDHIVTNLMRALLVQTDGRPCRIFTADMRVKVNPTGMYTYPDLSALCGEPHFEDTFLDTLINPNVIIEVLSGTTAAHDRGAKLEHYKRLESLRECVLIEQTAIHVERWHRDGKLWRQSNVEERLELPSIGCEITVSKIYDGVKFPENSRWPRRRRPVSQ